MNTKCALCSEEIEESDLDFMYSNKEKTLWTAACPHCGFFIYGSTEEEVSKTWKQLSRKEASILDKIMFKLWSRMFQ